MKVNVVANVCIKHKNSCLTSMTGEKISICDIQVLVEIKYFYVACDNVKKHLLHCEAVPSMSWSFPLFVFFL